MKHAILIALGVILLTGLIFLVIPADQDIHIEDAPWVVVPQGDRVKTLGIVLGRDVFQSVVDNLGEPEGIAAFRDDDGDFSSLEVYYGTVNAGGVRGKMILNLEVPADVSSMIEESSNAKRTNVGTHKLLFDEYHLGFPRQQTVVAISYAPSYRGFTEELIIQWYGEPESRVPEKDGEYWFYPEKHLDLTWDGSSRIFLEFKK